MTNQKENLGVSQVLEERVIHAGQWSELVELKYQDQEQKTRKWECLHRKNRAEAVIIIPRMEPSGRYILIRQFRPPTNSYMLEFPAGLIDAGESPETTAIRELYEETGYKGEFKSLSPKLYSSPGILSEAVYFAYLQIDETHKENQDPEANNEPDEFIQVFLVKPSELASFFKQEAQKGVEFDVKLYSYFMAQGLVEP